MKRLYRIFSLCLALAAISSCSAAKYYSENNPPFYIFDSISKLSLEGSIGKGIPGPSGLLDFTLEYESGKTFEFTVSAPGGMDVLSARLKGGYLYVRGMNGVTREIELKDSLPGPFGAVIPVFAASAGRSLPLPKRLVLDERGGYIPSPEEGSAELVYLREEGVWIESYALPDGVFSIEYSRVREKNTGGGTIAFPTRILLKTPSSKKPVILTITGFNYNY